MPSLEAKPVPILSKAQNEATLYFAYQALAKSDPAQTSSLALASTWIAASRPGTPPRFCILSKGPQKPIVWHMLKLERATRVFAYDVGQLWHIRYRRVNYASQNIAEHVHGAQELTPLKYKFWRVELSIYKWDMWTHCRDLARCAMSSRELGRLTASKEYLK